MTAAPGPHEGQVLTAAEIGPEHHGWYVRIALPPALDEPLPGPLYRSITVIGSRQWNRPNDGGRQVGLLATSAGPWAGEEHHMAAETEVRLERHFKRGVPRLRPSDYTGRQP